MKERAIIILVLAGILTLSINALSKPRAIHVEWEYQFNGNVAGFRLYHENIPVCETLDPNAVSMDCTLSLPDGKAFFTLTTVFQDGTESPHSPVFSYIFSSKLLAVMTAEPPAGSTPLAVAFDATSSKGNILNYDWIFGDGAAGAGSSINHTFFSAGSYTATLKITDTIGATDRETVSIIATTPSTDNMPPLAVISSSSSVGEAPLPVQFDGSGSTDSDGSILAFDWDMGDGETATGTPVENTYITAGTFHAALTVTDNGGLTDSSSTPVLVSEPAEGANLPPAAVISASTNQGTAPLSLTFDAGGSSDPDGEIYTYSWSFGDGTNAAGILVDHIYIQPGVYTARLKVTDTMGAIAEAVYTVTVQAGSLESVLVVELGSVTINNSWSRVALTKDFVNPIVIVGPPGNNDSEPCIVRIRNADTTGFDIRIQEWDYLDGIHGYETVHYMVIEQGSYTLDDGSKVEAGSFTGGIRFQRYDFQTPFQTAPVLLTTISSINEGDAVTGRIRKLSPASFEFKLSEQENNRIFHADETTGYIAWEVGMGTIGQFHFEVDRTENSVTNQLRTIKFKEYFSDSPLFFATMQSYNSGENSTVRQQNLTATEVLVRIEEEASKDLETDHSTEVVGYMVLSSIAE